MNFYDVISVENLFAAWREFCRGKRKKKDVAVFELNLEDNIFELHRELSAGAWKPAPYATFCINDPRPRIIHRANVRDRVLFQAAYRKLYPIFDPTFIFDSYSSRLKKGTHAGFRRLTQFTRKISLNFRRQGFCLKCDIRKFFDSVDHDILLKLAGRKIFDEGLLELIRTIVFSFEKSPGKGLPLGNVTSQLFANIYLNELDRFVKHELKAKYYIRYCDDFVILDKNLAALLSAAGKVGDFLRRRLKLELHPRKVSIRKITQGIDFLGYVALPHRAVLRTKTKRRILGRVCTRNLYSYLGLCAHAKAIRFVAQIKKITEGQ